MTNISELFGDFMHLARFGRVTPALASTMSNSLLCVDHVEWFLYQLHKLLQSKDSLSFSYFDAEVILIIC